MLKILNKKNSILFESSFSSVNGNFDFIKNINLEKNSKLIHIKIITSDSCIRRESFLNVTQETGSLYKSYNFIFAKNDFSVGLNVSLDGNSSSCHIEGINFAYGNAKVVQKIALNHNSKGTSSFGVFRGIYGDSSLGILDGVVNVSNIASKTKAFFLSKNLLISDKAKVKTAPKFKIFNDDVECNHGASIGFLDADLLLYLAARGLSYKAAKKILMYSFVGDLISSVPFFFFRNKIETVIENWFSNSEPR